MSEDSGVPSHRRNRVCRVAHGPYHSGTSRQATPVPNFHTIPFSTVRSSNRFLSRNDSGSTGRANSRSASDTALPVNREGTLGHGFLLDACSGRSRCLA